MARLRVEVVHALAERQAVVHVQLVQGATAGDAVRASGLEAAGLAIGIGGKVVEPDKPLRDGERVELLRPLAADPNEARRKRARRTRSAQRR